MEDLKTRAMNAVGAPEVLAAVKAATRGLREARIDKIAPVVARKINRLDDSRVRETIIALENAGLISVREGRGNVGGQMSLTNAGWNAIGCNPPMLLEV